MARGLGSRGSVQKATQPQGGQESHSGTEMPAETWREGGSSQAGTWGKRSQSGWRMGRRKPAPCLQPGHSTYLLYDWVILFIGHTRGEPAVRSGDSICKGERKAWPVSQRPADPPLCPFRNRCCSGREEPKRQTGVDLLSMCFLESIMTANI